MPLHSSACEVLPRLAADSALLPKTNISNQQKFTSQKQKETPEGEEKPQGFWF